MSELQPSLSIYFLTGTGNSYWSATHLSETAADFCDEIKVTPTDQIRRVDKPPDNRNDIVAFSYPTHGFSLPWHMLKFILRFPRGKGRVIIMNNRAGMKMGKIFTPGLSGIAILLPMLIMILKGYRIAGVVPLDTPSNWITIHPGLRQKVVDSIILRRSREISALCNRIRINRSYFPLKFIIPLPVDLLIAPISLGYMFFGRFMFARTYLADSSCDGCAICATRCPVSAIKMVSNKPWWSYRCESCMRCSNVCPKNSVNSSVPLLALYILVFSKISGSVILTSLLETITGAAEWLPEKLIYYLFMWIITILVTYILYFILFYLNRIKLFSHLIAMTTPMRYWRHYIAPGFKGLYKGSKET